MLSLRKVNLVNDFPIPGEESFAEWGTQHSQQGGEVLLGVWAEGRQPICHMHQPQPLTRYPQRLTYKDNAIE